MEEIFLSERIFTKDNQESFATLSGDWNPLHVDEEIARRTLAGSTVVHGIHGVLWALNIGLKLNHIHNIIESIQVKFHTSIKLHETVQCFFTEGNEKSNCKIIIRSSESLKTTIILSFSNSISFIPIPEDKYIKSSPKIYDFKKISAEEYTQELKFNKTLYKTMFSCLENKFSDTQISLLLGISNIIGMQCPGYHSLFSSFNIFWSGSSDNSIKYQISDYNERFSSIKIMIKSGEAKGQLHSFIRPSLVEQKLTRNIKNNIPKKIFSKWKVLIIGGSRGLGEASVRVLTQGGAKSCITYYKGLGDAKKISKETASEILYLDILSDYKINLDWQPTHLLYFATPNIVSEDASIDAERLSRLYKNYFIKGFKDIINKINYGQALNVFYPSTIYIDDKNKKFESYAAVKKTGEEICNSMNQSHSNLNILYPRLPRLKTDLTASLINSDSLVATSYLLNIYKKWK